MPIAETFQDSAALGGLPLYSVIALVFLLLGRFDVFVQLVIGLVACYGIIALVRLFFFRTRPDRQKYRGFLTKIDAGSFPSLHSARAAVLAVVLSQVFVQPFVRVFLWVLVIVVALMRVVLRRHFVGDVIGGVVLGLLVGWLVLLASPYVLAGFGGT